MNGDYLLDPSVIIPLVEQELDVADRVGEARSILIPGIPLGELHYGAAKSARERANAERADRYALEVGVLPCDAGTSRIYGSLRWGLRLKGKPIPDNDIWIAALAIQHGLTLATRDKKHFQHVDDLVLELW